MRSNVGYYIDNNFPSSSTVETNCEQKDSNNNSISQENMCVQKYIRDFGKTNENEEYNNICEYDDSENSYSDESISVQNDDAGAF